VIVDINGARIHYRREGAGFPILMFHAGIADSRMWQPQADEFAEQYDVIRPDMRGFGDSELPPRRWSPVGDVIALMDELALKPAHLIGCSLGGRLAIDLALDHPARVSKLVLVGPAVGGDSFGKKYPEVFAEVRAAAAANDVEALNQAEARLFLDGPGRARGHVGGEVRELFLDMNRRDMRNDHESAPMDELDPPAIGRLHEISAPTLVVIGDEDIPSVFDRVDLVMDSIKGARKAVIHDAAHLPNLEHPEEFNRIVLNFLTED
jgi:pimeloyl-ACP methyl ester carboxylesterase